MSGIVLVHAIAHIAIIIVELFAALLVVDFISGLMHWAEDTWMAPGKSRLLDTWIVRDNIEHHRTPGAIRAGSYWITNRVCIALALGTALILAIAHVHAWEAYFILALASQANQIHLWAHCANPPRPIKWLQSTGLLQSTAHHAVHHKKPYAVRYCAVTNFLNPVLDKMHFWRGLESLIAHCGATVFRATPARGGY